MDAPATSRSMTGETKSQAPECPSVRQQKGVLWVLHAVENMLAVKGMTRSHTDQHEEVLQASVQGKSKSEEKTQREGVSVHLNLCVHGYPHLLGHPYSRSVNSQTAVHPEWRREVPSEEEDPVGPQDGLNFVSSFLLYETKQQNSPVWQNLKICSVDAMNIWVFHLYNSQYFLCV